MENKKINVSLTCITCGGANFNFNEDRTYVKCTTCNREYLGGYDEMVEFNQEQIHLAMDETKQQIGEELKEELIQSLKDVFKRNKFIKFK